MWVLPFPVYSDYTDVSTRRPVSKLEGMLRHGPGTASYVTSRYHYDVFAPQPVTFDAGCPAGANSQPILEDIPEFCNKMFWL